MRVIEMERKTLDRQPVYKGEAPIRDWWGVIETEEEEMVYNTAIRVGEGFLTLWNSMLKHAGLPFGLKWGEDDIYGYIRPDEVPPEVGDEYVDGDDDKWVRVE